MLKLSAAWCNRLAMMPETGMTYTIATIVLKDGRQFPQAVICEGSIGPIRGCPGVPFTEEDIAEIHPTHDKWDFNANT
jgi:hypothetical protein